MSCKTHEKHDHKHGDNCGHQAIKHDDHTCYVHDGHLHYVHEDHVDEHVYSGEAGKCTPDHKCEGHDAGHKHGEKCGHDSIPHGDHTDYLVEGHLHSPCADHCDHHGKVS